MKRGMRLLALVASLCFTAPFAQALVYTWTGGVDSDWSNTLNWDGNGIPIVNDIGSVYNSANTITIQDGSYSPTSNVPAFASKTHTLSAGTPRFDIKAGASLDISADTPEGDAYVSPDGIAVTVATDGSMTFSNPGSKLTLGRDVADQTYNITGGTLAFVADQFRLVHSAGKASFINLDGGTLDLRGVSRLYASRAAYGDFSSLSSQIILSNGSAVIGPATRWMQTIIDEYPAMVFDIQDAESYITLKKGDLFGTEEELVAEFGTTFISSTRGDNSLVATDMGTYFIIKSDTEVFVGEVSVEMLPGGKDVVISWETSVLGTFGLESTESIAYSEWTDVVSGLAGTGSEMSVTTTVSSAETCFYRAYIED